LTKNAAGEFTCDFSAFFFGYPTADLISAGMPRAHAARLFQADVPLDERWQLAAPYYKHAWHTAYMRNVRESIRCVSGQEDITADNLGEISEAVASMNQPGGYRRVLQEKCGIESCQVASLEAHVFHESEAPDLLYQDFHFDPLCFEWSFMEPEQAVVIRDLSAAAGREPSSLAAWHDIIDWHFSEYGPKAIAMKHASAYTRRLDYLAVTKEDAAPIFDRFIKDPQQVPEADRKALHDHLFHYCIEKSVAYRLPVKMHTGYYAGSEFMPLERLRRNLSDLCSIIDKHPDARFVLFHMTYPYHDEAVALVKHLPNVYLDLCWAWILNTPATVRVVKDFLLTAPFNKLLGFGGDYWNLEGVPGHAAIAREGITRVFTELLAESWIADDQVVDLVQRLMGGNARGLFDYPRALVDTT